jgi:hypothetical protein
MRHIEASGSATIIEAKVERDFLISPIMMIVACNVILNPMGAYF